MEESSPGAPASDSDVRAELVNNSYKDLYGYEVRFTSLVGGFGGITEAGELISGVIHNIEGCLLNLRLNIFSVARRFRGAAPTMCARHQAQRSSLLLSSFTTIVALRSDGSVIPWGNATNGGYNPSAQEKHDLLALGHLNGSSNKKTGKRLSK